MSAHTDETVADKLLRLLYERREGFATLSELAAAVGADAAAVNAALAALRHRGQRLEDFPGHGVRLVRPAALDAGLIERELGTQRVGRGVLCFEEVDSTNDVARDSARQADADGLVILAESQRQGRGRLGRRWVSPAGANVLMSVLLLDPSERLAHEAVTIAAGLATAEAIDAVAQVHCALKWPNDVLVDGLKTAGVLVELTGAESGRAVVVGIGVNVHAAPPPEGLVAPATCLAERVGHPLERIELARAVLRRLDAWTADIEVGRLDGLHEAWLGRSGLMNHRLTVARGGQRYVGRAVDVHPLEGLVLVGDRGERMHFPAETTTIVDVNGA